MEHEAVVDMPKSPVDQRRRADLPTSAQLIRSTITAAFLAAAALFTFILPAEYGVDPTGLGALTRAIEIGERKMPLGSFVHRSDQMSVTLKPGHAAEVKLRMKNGAKASYSWSVTGGTVSFNSHGEGPRDAFKRYNRGANASARSGEIEAAFYGHHGWFWRNPGDKPVTVTVKTSGNYADIKLID